MRILCFGSLYALACSTLVSREIPCVLMQLPLYVPNEAEKADPKLYAANVRAMMMREGHFFSSEASLLDSRAYIALLRGKPPPPKSRAGQVTEGMILYLYHVTGLHYSFHVWQKNC